MHVSGATHRKAYRGMTATARALVQGNTLH
jgi:hypothetical protein